MHLCKGHVLRSAIVAMAMAALLASCSGVRAIAIDIDVPAAGAAVNETNNNYIDDVPHRSVTIPEQQQQQQQQQQQHTVANVQPVVEARSIESGATADVDDYVLRNRRQCMQTHGLLACAKYKAARVLWRVATNALGYFPNEHSRELGEDRRRVRLVQLAEPADDALQLFSNARSMQGDGEWLGALKFLQRTLDTFGRRHGLQLLLSGDTGARITSAELEEPRLKKRKQKWLILLPLLILMKIAHLKMTVVTLMLGVLGLNVVLVGGTAWLIHYLKFKTLCKIHPHLVQSHSHVYDSDPAEYSSFVGSGHTGAHYGAAGYGSHEASVHGWANKDWSSSKAYSGHNYLDTISKRLQ